MAHCRLIYAQKPPLSRYTPKIFANNSLRVIKIERKQLFQSPNLLLNLVFPEDKPLKQSIPNANTTVTVYSHP